MIYTGYAHRNACRSSYEVSIACRVATTSYRHSGKWREPFSGNVALRADVPQSRSAWFSDFPVPRKDVPSAVMRTRLRGRSARNVLQRSLLHPLDRQLCLYCDCLAFRPGPYSLWKRLRKIMRRPRHLPCRAPAVACHRPSSRVTVPSFKAFAPHLPQQRSDNLC